MVSWDAPDQCWRFALGEDAPADLPNAWAAAADAVARDLHCRRHGRPVTFANISWRFVASDGWLALGFEAPPGADIDTYERCMGARVETAVAQAMVWLAEDVQYELTGYEFVQWPAAGKRVLEPRLVEDHAVWTEPGTDTIVAPIGELCTAPASPHLM